MEETDTSTQQQVNFEVGEVVDVRHYGRAVVLEQLQIDTAHPFFGRYKIKYQSNGAVYNCRPEEMRRIAPTTKRVLVCETTREYRAAVTQNVAPDDVCLEVGCHEGETTNKISRRCSFGVGVDKSEVTVVAARLRFPNLRFEVVDGFDIDKLMNLSPTGTFTKIFVDIGGIAELPTVLSLVSLYFGAFRKSTIIVKSVHMRRFLEMSEVFQCRNSWAVLPSKTFSADNNESTIPKSKPEISGAATS